MADSLKTQVLSALTALTTPADSDLFAVGTSNGGTMKKITFANLFNAIKSKLGITNGYILLGTVLVTPTVPMLSSGATSSVIYTNFTPPSGTTLCVPVVHHSGYNTMTSCDISGNTLQTKFLNMSGGSHSGGGAVTILCFKKV